MYPGCINGMNFMYSSKNSGNQRCCKFLNKGPENSVFLRRPAHSGKGPDSVCPMINLFHLEYREIMGKAVISQMVSERTFWQLTLRINDSGKAEISLCQDGQAAGR
jgi:hypothetical protein